MDKLISFKIFQLLPRIKKLVKIAKEKGMVKNGQEAFNKYPPKSEGYFREEKIKISGGNND